MSGLSLGQGWSPSDTDSLLLRLIEDNRLRREYL